MKSVPKYIFVTFTKRSWIKLELSLIHIYTVLYNLYPTVEDKTIQDDTMEFIRAWLEKYFPETKFLLVPEIGK